MASHVSKISWGFPFNGYQFIDKDNYEINIKVLKIMTVASSVYHGNIFRTKFYIWLEGALNLAFSGVSAYLECRTKILLLIRYDCSVRLILSQDSRHHPSWGAIHWQASDRKAPCPNSLWMHPTAEHFSLVTAMILCIRGRMKIEKKRNLIYPIRLDSILAHFCSCRRRFLSFSKWIGLLQTSSMPQKDIENAKVQQQICKRPKILKKELMMNLTSVWQSFVAWWHCTAFPTHFQA